ARAGCRFGRAGCRLPRRRLGRLLLGRGLNLRHDRRFGRLLLLRRGRPGGRLLGRRRLLRTRLFSGRRLDRHHHRRLLGRRRLLPRLLGGCRLLCGLLGGRRLGRGRLGLGLVLVLGLILVLRLVLALLLRRGGLIGRRLLRGRGLRCLRWRLLLPRLQAGRRLCGGGSLLLLVGRRGRLGAALPRLGRRLLFARRRLLLARKRRRRRLFLDLARRQGRIQVGRTRLQLLGRPAREVGHDIRRHRRPGALRGPHRTLQPRHDRAKEIG